MLCVKKEGKNRGRMFFACPLGKSASCGFFVWADEAEDPSAGGGGGGSGSSGVGGGSGQARRPIRCDDPRSIEQLFGAASFGVYLECEVRNKTWQKKGGRMAVSSKQWVLAISHRERSNMSVVLCAVV
jgi:hypothetical protein